MMTQEQQELIQAGADGELDAAGQLELDQLLEVSTEARALFEELQRMNAFLATVPPQEPPATLHGQIMEGIQLPRTSPLKRFLRR